MRYLPRIGSLLIVALIVLVAMPPVRADANDNFAEGQRLFNEKKFQAALDQFKEADALVPNEPRVYSWIAACLNELGQYAEAEKRVQGALEIIREAQKQDASKLVTVPPIDVGYFSLLALVQTNLKEYEKARATLDTYKFNDDGSEDAKNTKQALAAAKQTIRARMVVIGTECVKTGDLECTRKAFSQAEAIQPSNPPLLETVARDAVAKADREPKKTEEEKANRAKQFDVAVKTTRMWVAEAPHSPEAQRLLAKALTGGRTKEGCEEATKVLTTLWDASTDPAKRDSTIQLDLAAAQSCLEQWEQAAAAASQFITLNPDDARGQGYCIRSIAQFKLGHCPETIEDGARCKDGTAQPLVEACQKHIAKVESSRKEAEDRAQAENLKARCSHLYERVKWARSPLNTDLPLEDLVDFLDDYRASESACRSTMEEKEKGFTSPVPQVCASGAKIASYPLNLSARGKDDLEALRAKTLELKKLCKASWDAPQAASVESGLKIIDGALARL
jgi:tetratricopeptide (TPR) repeat protein